ncbi:hypothetical protein M9Y10_010081 [Tritrichomonas musculus]|uniref:Uncharacterized protein n=1 Tax=Tritrichomonas musculus TaxID=1915356 RepID=A0ABR2IQB1_9EUKA
METINHVCGYKCEAINHEGQFFVAQSNEPLINNSINFVTTVFCGTKNFGHSSIIVGGNTGFILTYINSSHNYNKLSEKSYGTCFRTSDLKSFNVQYFNFIHSTGVDIVNTHNTPEGILDSGNFQNCSTTYVFKYRGKIVIRNSYFDNLVHESSYFEYGGPSYTATILTVYNCRFDVKPNDFNLDASNIDENPLKTTQIIGHENLDNCPVASDRFTQSEDFTISSIFTSSSQFTKSSQFSPSNKFSDSKSFTSSSQFSSSKSFTSSSQFTKSSPFSQSAVFSDSKSFTPSSQFSDSKSFTPSSQFSDSKSFTPSSQFSDSKSFTPSSQFSDSKSFTPSSQFSESESFSPSAKFDHTKSFTPSFQFSKSDTFTESLKFTLSRYFSSSSKFTSSPSFSPSFHFSRSKQFSPSDFILITVNQTSPFTPSNVFTPSFTFSPNATKYPDGLGGYDRAQVSGGHLQSTASTASIGATAGISLGFLGISVPLMILYLRNRQRQLRREIDISDEFLYDSSEQSTSYSYSYYTYDYEYEYGEYDEHEYASVSRSYSDFNGAYVSFDD